MGSSNTTKDMELVNGKLLAEKSGSNDGGMTRLKLKLIRLSGKMLVLNGLNNLLYSVKPLS